MIAVGDNKGGVALLDASSGAIAWEANRKERVLAVSISSDGSIIAAGGYDETISLLDSVTGALKMEIQFLQVVKSICFSPDGSSVAAGGKSGRVALFSCKNGELLWEVSREGSIKSLKFSPAGDTLVFCGTGLSVVLLDAKAGSQRWKVENTNKMRTLSFSPNGEVIALGDDNGCVSLLDTSTGEWGESFSCGLFVFAVQWTPDGCVLAVLEGDYHDKKFLMLDLESGGEKEVITGQAEDRRCEGLAAACLSPDGCTVATASGGCDEDCRVKLTEVSTGHVLWDLKRGDSVNSICFSSAAGTSTSESPQVSTSPGEVHS
eukprot:TRINITY_DN3503_c5_g1_i1.p1 TRINITY_DN3503_c5_g1~~TRINITY_DN3503_c5_g1_i1.p1  ORF type:complete len:339 (-),score=49.93 TRINITY_DN3503_c5_g1_i1:63-1019(-)